MKRRKIILLPADEKIFQLYEGDVWSSKIYQNNEDKIPGNILGRLNINWLQTIARIVLFIGIVLVPLLISLLVILILMAVVWLYKDKNAAENIGDKFIQLLKKFRNPIPLYNNDKNELDWKIKSKLSQKENIPEFLDRAAKYRYERIICVDINDSNKVERSNALIKRDFLDSILLYNDDAEIYAYLLKDDILQDYSWIIRLFENDNISNMVGGRVLYKYDDIEFEKPNKDFICSYAEASNRIMFSRIRLPHNKLLDETIVLYFETEYNKEVNDYISNHYKEIQIKLAKSNLKLLFLPTIKALENDADVQNLYELISTHLQIPDGPSPAFIHCVQQMGNDLEKKNIVYSYSPITGKDQHQIGLEIDRYIEYARYPKDEIYYSLGNKYKQGDAEYDADNEFYWEGSQISDEVKQKIEEIEKKTSEDKVLETLLYIINEFKDKKPELCNKLSKQIYDEVDKTFKKKSRIYIDKQFRIFLKDYGNIEIELTPLPKTFFLFMLKYPEGVMFKELYKYKQELINIYCRIGNRSDLEQMQKSINDMTNARSNSVNEKCSRIKEAFLSKIDNRIALQYYVSGNRHEPKKIPIDRSLVIFEEVL